MDFSSPNRPKQEALVANPSPVEDSKLGLPPAVLAGLACVVPFLGSILGLVEREQPFVKHYAIQSLIFWVLAFLTALITRPLVTGEGLIRNLISLVFIIPVGIIMLIFFGLLALLLFHAFSGLVYYLPYTRKILVGPLNPMRQAVSAANTVSQHRKD